MFYWRVFCFFARRAVFTSKTRFSQFVGVCSASHSMTTLAGKSSTVTAVVVCLDESGDRFIRFNDNRRRNRAERFFGVFTAS